MPFSTLKLLLALLLLPLVGYAQFPPMRGGGAPVVKGTIRGVLVDSITQQPLEYASVVLTLPGGKMLDGQITDEKGVFRFREVNTSKYEIQATFIGYEPKTIRNVVTTPEKPDLDLGKVFLGETAAAKK